MNIPSFLLNGGISLPAIGYGTFLIPADDAARAVSTAISTGYRHVDTAAVYDNEAAVGAGLREGMSAAGLSRADLFVTTKLWPGYPAWGEAVKDGDQTIAACQHSLDLLQLDYVDLYLIHSPHAGDKRIAQWEALLELKQSGRVRAIGVSNYSRLHLQEIADAGLELPAANQIELHPWSQKPELVGYMRDQGIFPIAYSSLAPLSTWRTAPGHDSAKSEDMKSDDALFSRMATKYGVTEAQLLLRWGVQSGFAVLPKSLNESRMKQNLELDGFSIDAADVVILAGLDRGPGIAWSVGDPIETA
jgi:2,5-diketo-D-gluconate reductase A